MSLCGSRRRPRRFGSGVVRPHRITWVDATARRCRTVSVPPTPVAAPRRADGVQILWGTRRRRRPARPSTARRSVRRLRRPSPGSARGGRGSQRDRIRQMLYRWRFPEVRQVWQLRVDQKDIGLTETTPAVACPRHEHGDLIGDPVQRCRNCLDRRADRTRFGAPPLAGLRAARTAVSGSFAASRSTPTTSHSMRDGWR